MEKKEGILLSGRGRQEQKAELSSNEGIFDEIADFLFTEGEGIKEKYGSVNNLKRDLIKEVRRRNNISKQPLSMVLKHMLGFYKMIVKEDKIRKERQNQRLNKILIKLEDLPSDIVEASFEENRRSKKDELVN